MRRSWAVLIAVALLVLLVSSCERMNPAADLSKVSAIQSIPLEYGALKGVTSTEQYPGWSQLWFQDEGGTIRMVRVNWMGNQQFKEVLTIPRTQGSLGGK